MQLKLQFELFSDFCADLMSIILVRVFYLTAESPFFIQPTVAERI